MALHSVMLTIVVAASTSAIETHASRGRLHVVPFVDRERANDSPLDTRRTSMQQHQPVDGFGNCELVCRLMNLYLLLVFWA